MIKLVAILIAVAVIAVLKLVQRQKPVIPQQNSISGKAKDDTNKPLLKQFGDLTLPDFDQPPVWVNCHVIDYGKAWYDDTDEETFRSWDGDLPVDPAEAMFLVKAKLTLADGTEYDGFITPQQESSEPDLGTIQPYLFTKSGEVFSFWFGILHPSQEEINSFYEELGKSVKQVFPIQFKAEDGYARGVIAGTIPGFCRSGKNGEVIMEK